MDEEGTNFSFLGREAPFSTVSNSNDGRYSDTQRKLLQATDNETPMPNQSHMVQIAQMTFDRFLSTRRRLTESQSWVLGRCGYTGSEDE